MRSVSNYIGGEFVSCSDHIESVNPATGEVWARIPNSSPQDVHNAVTAANHAFHKWSRLSYLERADYLNAIAAGIESRREELVKLESTDQGKPMWLANMVDIPRAVRNLKEFADAVPHITERAHDMAGCLNYTSRSAVGVAGLIIPWNLPLYLLTFKLAPALITGNTVVCKPSEMTSVTAGVLAEIIHQAGVPAGVVNFVFGLGAISGEALITHPDVPIVSFTGSTATGRHIAQVTAPMFKKVSLEMGGKNACVVFADADLDMTVECAVRSCFINQGEICLATERIFVHRDIFTQFMEKFVAATKSKRVGPPEESSSFVGALVSSDHYNKVEGYVKRAIRDGATLHTGYTMHTLDLPDKNKNGYFFPPTILSGLSDASEFVCDEVFGPVCHVSVFDSEEEVLRRANNTQYGLCAAIFSQNVSTITRVAKQLQVGTVWCNCWLIRDLDMPFGGCKQSGTGREGIIDSLESYTQHKTVCIKY